jgi:hypothetical protein
MKKTAVEWLYKNLLDNPMSNEDVIYNINMFEIAKQMEKKQIIDFAEDYEINESEKYPQKTFEQYYNETFKKEI